MTFGIVDTLDRLAGSWQFTGVGRGGSSLYNNMGQKVLNSKIIVVIVDFQPKVHGTMKTKQSKFLSFFNKTNKN